MNANTKKLYELSQGLWVDNINREMLVKGDWARYVANWFVTGLTSNPTVVGRAIGHGSVYDQAIERLAPRQAPAKSLIFAPALEDLKTAVDLLRSEFKTTNGLDGWVSRQVSPLLVDNAATTVRMTARLHEASDRPNLVIKMPGAATGVFAFATSWRALLARIREKNTSLANIGTA